MKKFLKNKPLVISLVLLILIFCGLLIAWFSALYTLNHMGFKQITTTQMAAAMRQDEFWYDYRFDTLIFEGKIQSISIHNTKKTLTFVTSDSYSASCEVAQNIDYQVGRTYKFAAETYQAERQPKGILLHNCINL